MIRNVRHVSDVIQRKTKWNRRRSRHWRSTRKHFIKENPKCEVCGAKRGLEVHHILPFHIAPERELDFANLATLCKTCHLFVGHLRSYNHYNKEFWLDVSTWKEKIKESRR